MRVGGRGRQPVTPAATASAAPTVSASATAAGTRLVRHERGETAVPAAPARVVVLDSPLLDTLVTLGPTPVGAVRTAVDDGLPDYLAPQAAGVTVLGTIGSPNLEAVAALRPDLILSSTLRDDAVYDKLSAIAPTVFTKGPGTTRRSDFLLAGEAVNRGSRPGSRSRTSMRRPRGRGRPSASPAGRRRSCGSCRTRRACTGRTASPAASCARSGSARRGWRFDEFAIAGLSAEQISSADADVIFATTYGAAEDSTKGVGCTRSGRPSR